VTGDDGANLIDVGGGWNVVHAGDGNDTIVGSASAFYSSDGQGEDSYVDRLYGEAGDDLIRGNGSWTTAYWTNASRDYLDGGSGNDTLIGGQSMETHNVGGDGADLFVFESGAFFASDLGPAVGGRATIEDFDRGEGDKIEIIAPSEYEDGTPIPDGPVRPTFVGEVGSFDDLRTNELGYQRGAAGTSVWVCNGSAEDGLGEYYSFMLTLAGYTGSLSESDFILA